MKHVLNPKMLKLIVKKVVLNYQLNATLLNLLSDGFVVNKECYFLKSLYKKQRHIKASYFADNVGYEGFINSIHFSDYIEDNIFEQALLFSDRLIKEWNALNNGLILMLFLSQTDSGFLLKFHLYRGKDRWIEEDDICKFEEPIIIFNSCD